MSRGLLIGILVLLAVVTSGRSGDVRAGERMWDDRFGVILVSDDPAQVTAFGALWFINARETHVEPPAGTVMPRILRTNPPLEDDELRALVAANPGGFWLIGNEPNVAAIGNTAPEHYAEALHHYAEVINSVDPDATLIGPNVLNWSFTCAGCPGFPAGADWTPAMRAAYRERYDAEPPLDVWALHTYDLDWTRFPNGDAARQREQVLGLRGWLDGIPALQGAPLWITEAGIHWGFRGLRFRNGLAEPAGPYDEEAVSAYLTNYFGWLRDAAAELRLERWFVWALTAPEPESFATVYGGIALMDGLDNVTPLGLIYRRLAGAEP